MTTLSPGSRPQAERAQIGKGITMLSKSLTTVLLIAIFLTVTSTLQAHHSAVADIPTQSPAVQADFPAPFSDRLTTSVSWPGIAQNLEILDEIGGTVNAVTVRGSYAYMAVGQQLVVVDVSSPTRPAILGKTGIIPGAVIAVEVMGDYAYALDGNGGLNIINVSNPAAPRQTSYYAVPDARPYRMALSGDYIYLGDQWKGLIVICVADPFHPVQVGSVDGFTGSPLNLAASGQYAYVDGEGTFRVIDVSNPSAPVVVGSTRHGLWVVGLAVKGQLAYGAGASNGLLVIDISNPSAPTFLGVIQGTPKDRWDVDHVFAVGNLLLVNDSNRGVRIVDTSNPAAWVETAIYDTQGAADDVWAEGRYAYIVDRQGTLRIVDVGNPWSPILVGAAAMPGPRAASDVAWSQGFVYVVDLTGGLSVLDASNPSALSQVGRFAGSGSFVSVDVAGNRAYVADGIDGFHIVDVSNPAAPVRIGGSSVEGYGREIEVSGDIAYIAAVQGGLRVFDVSNPGSPRKIGSYDASDASALALAGHYAYLADGYNVRIFDISRPAQLALVGSYGLWSYAYGLAVVESQAYVVSDQVLTILNVANPAAPQLVGQRGFSFFGYKIAVMGKYAYVTSYDGALQVFDVSDPATPILVGYASVPPSARGIALSPDGTIYLAEATNGLLTLRLRLPQAAFSATPSSGLAPLTAQFLNQTAGDYTESLWDFGDGVSSTEQNPTHNFTIPGWYTVSLTVQSLEISNSISNSNAIHVYVPRPVLASPVCGTTNTVSPAISGVAEPGYAVTLYDDGVSQGATVASLDGSFVFTPTLTGGLHPLTVTAISTGTNLASLPLTLTLNPGLNYNPVGVLLSYNMAQGTVTQHPRGPDGCANPDKWRVWLRAGYTTTVSIPVSYTNSAIVTVTLGNQSRVMADPIGSLHVPFVLTFTPPISGSTFAVKVTADGQTTGASGSTMIDSEGYVFDKQAWVSHGITQTLAGISVKCEYWDTAAGAWLAWKGWAYDRQANPQMTGADGQYAFFVPPGTYRIRASHPDYWPYASPDILVQGQPARLNIPLALARRIYLPILFRQI